MTDDARIVNDSLRLAEYFYKPRSIEDGNVFDGLVRGLATQTAQKMDLHLVPDVRYSIILHRYGRYYSQTNCLLT